MTKNSFVAEVTFKEKHSLAVQIVLKEEVLLCVEYILMTINFFHDIRRGSSYNLNRWIKTESSFSNRFWYDDKLSLYIILRYLNALINAHFCVKLTKRITLADDIIFLLAVLHNSLIWRSNFSLSTEGTPRSLWRWNFSYFLH